MALDRPIRQWNGLTIPEPGVYVLDDAHKRIGFVAQHMMVSPIRGEFAEGGARIVVAEDPLRSTVSATIRSASVNTHNPDRDAHLAGPDFLDAGTYPTLEYRGTGLLWQGGERIFQWAQLRGGNPLGRRGARPGLPAAAVQVAAKFLVRGHLTVRNLTRSVDLEMEFGGARRDPYGRDIFGFSATTEVDREDFGLVWNMLLESGGVLIGKKVRIEIAGEAVRAS